jgi:short-subunit dehydrogenase
MKLTLKPIEQQTIVITGASSGIGLATALKAASRGARLVLCARNGDALAAVEQRIAAAGGKATHVVADVAKRDELERVSQHAIERFGGYDTWVNNAGIGIFGRLNQVSEADSRRLFDTNFWGVVNGSLIAVEHLRSKGGALINLGSVVSDVAFPVQGMYCASKHAIKGFTDSLRMELDEEGAPISVTLIKPSAINTPFATHAKNYFDRKPKLPPPIYAPEDVAATIVHAAERGGRDYIVGGAGKLFSTLNKHVPGAVDWGGARAVSPQSLTNLPPDRPAEGSLYQPGQDGEVHGDTPHMVMRSAYTHAMLNPVLAASLVTVAGLGAAAVFGARNGRS